MTTKDWITDPRTGNHHLHGIPWHKAPRPRWLHRCRPWTIGTGPYGTIYRCACGALRIQGSRRWVGKNSGRLDTGWHKGGDSATQVLTGERLDELAAGAEKGYDLERLRPRKRRGNEATDE